MTTGRGFSWEGDLIIQDTRIRHKRFVIGAPQKQISMDIRAWISFDDDIVMKEILKKLRDQEALPSSKDPGDFDRRAGIIWNYVATSIEYVHDTGEYKEGDFWFFPSETFALRKGDCEDSTFLLASLLIASGISPFCVRVALGEVFDEFNRSLGGHCWPVYKNERGRWCILESTLDRAPAVLPEADRLTSAGQAFRYLPYYCFNNRHLWETLPAGTAAGEGVNIGKYFRARKNRVDMRNHIRRGHV
ncbi:MAG: transglutaminase-like domain-containing protein [Thermodesulfovibrionales bacterium]